MRHKKRLIVSFALFVCFITMYGCNGKNENIPQTSDKDDKAVVDEIADNSNQKIEEQQESQINNGNNTIVEEIEDGWDDTIVDKVVCDLGDWPKTIYCYYNPLTVELNSFYACIITAQSFAKEMPEDETKGISVTYEDFEKRMYQYFGMTTQVSDSIDNITQYNTMNISKNPDGTIGLWFYNEPVDYEIASISKEGNTYKAIVEYENATAEYVFAKFEDSRYGFVIKDAAYYCKGYDPENGVNDDTLLDYVYSYYGYYIDREDIKIEESNDKKLIVSIPASEQVEYDGYSLTEKSTDKRITITIERKTLDFYTDEENGGEAQNLLNVDF